MMAYAAHKRPLDSCRRLAARAHRHTPRTIVGVVRKGEFIPNPDADFIFVGGDLISAMGNTVQLESFKDYLL